MYSDLLDPACMAAWKILYCAVSCTAQIPADAEGRSGEYFLFTLSLHVSYLLFVGDTNFHV